ncbi:hypothetical protein HYT32_02365 [Candidatus Roizmanbacteria bacterium]|nr:hypothetical protein [Candidatus Roizmanbacteria bacterium]
MKKIIKEYKDKSVKELEAEERKLREEITKSRLERKTAQVKDTNVLARKRKRLAVVLTLKTMKQEAEKLQVHPAEGGQK